MNFLLTGAVGFIASKVAELLLKDGHQVFGIDNFDDYYNPLLKSWRLEALSQHRNFRFLETDIQNVSCLRAVARDCGHFDAVIHLGAKAGVRPSVANPTSYYQTNVLGTLNVLDVCREFAIPKLVAASSSSVYGSNNPMPYREDADTNRPLSPYAASKKATEELCFTYHHLYGLDISMLRFFTVYGPAGRPDMSMFRFIRSIQEGQPLTVFGDGRQRRDFSFVEDIARGTIAALKTVQYRIFNLGANHPVELNHVIDSIARISDLKSIIDYKAADPTDVPATWADVSRAKSELDWEPRVCLEDGIEKSIHWYKCNREWAHAI
jgi:nucleoside-diphosphate-sugar epimerase